MHEEESESRVNRLARELAVLRVRQAQTQVHNNSNGTDGYTDGGPPMNGNGNGLGGPSSAPFVTPPEILDPSTEVLLVALKKENESLRNRLVSAERDYIRLTRLNEIYREELIDHRRRVRPFISVCILWRIDVKRKYPAAGFVC